MDKKQILQKVHEIERPQIRAGETHRFIDIWVVVVDGRMFCRQYALGAGWYNAFLKDPNGYIKVGNETVKINAIIPEDLDAITNKVNEAYIEKYTKRFTREASIARMMTGPEYAKTTMEIVLA